MTHVWRHFVDIQTWNLYGKFSIRICNFWTNLMSTNSGDMTEKTVHLFVCLLYLVQFWAHLPIRLIDSSNFLACSIYLCLNAKLLILQIGLHSLRTVSRGSIRIGKCPHLCYINTIDWTQIVGEDNLDYDSLNPESCSCPKRCNGEFSIETVSHKPC